MFSIRVHPCPSVVKLPPPHLTRAEVPRIVCAMIRQTGFTTVAVALVVAGCSTVSPKVHYPVTAKTNVVENYHGTAVADPYRWLEDDNSPETKAWVAAQNKVTFAYLNAIPGRDAIKARLTKLWNYERYGVPFKEGGRYFYSRNDGLQNQSVLYTVESIEAAPRVLLDPNTLSADGTVALAGLEVSEDGNLLAYGTSASGSDWEEWHVRDVRTGKDLPDHLQWVKFSDASWRKDGSGFFYSRYDAPKPGDALKGVNKFHKLYFHKLGTEQSADALVYERKDQPDWGFGGGVTEDGRWLVISVSEGTDQKNRVLYQALTKPGAPVVELLMDFDASYNFIGNDGSVFWFKTDLNASRSRVIAIDVTQPQRANWKELIPQSTDTLGGISVLNHQFVLDYLHDAHTLVKVFNLDGSFVREVALPGSRHGRRLRRQARGDGEFLFVHELYHAGNDLSLRRDDGRERSVPRAESGLRRELQLHRQRRFRVMVQDGLERVAQPGDRD